jgi:K+-transporting ATPase ATPase C chain
MKRVYLSIKTLLIFTFITGVLYPLAVTGIAQLFFPKKSGGSLLRDHKRIYGSALIGQRADSVIYFSPRPSATNYNPMPSGGSNLGLTNQVLKENVQERQGNFATLNCSGNTTMVPPEMLYASASGLDPHISPAAAMLQVERVSFARGFSVQQRFTLVRLVDSLTEKPQFSLFGEERINVLLLNFATDRIR